MDCPYRHEHQHREEYSHDGGALPPPQKKGAADWEADWGLGAAPTALAAATSEVLLCILDPPRLRPGV